MNGRHRSAGWWRWRILPAVVMAVAGRAADGGTSDNIALSRVYGAGVHAYFSGDFLRSYEDLSAVIEGGSRDPRALYFRGLAALRLGRLDEAEADFSRGADFEALAPGGWPVSRALERVQGNERLQLERHRARARVALLADDRDADRARSSGTREAQAEVLRRRRPAAMPAPADFANPFADQPGADRTPPSEPAPELPEPMPNPPEPSAPGPTDQGEPAQGEGAGSREGDEPFAENGDNPFPEADGGPLEAEMEQPPKPTEPADPAGAEDPFGDNAPR